jgi:PIN domain nuclease of toxin-antitoxin system
LPLVTDTHPLLYYESGRGGKVLPKRVWRAFESAAGSREMIVVPVIIFFEVDRLQQKGKIQIQEGSVIHWARNLLKRPGFMAQEITTEIVLEATALRLLQDPVDALIVATARVLNVPLITRDRQIADSHLVRILW